MSEMSGLAGYKRVSRRCPGFGFFNWVNPNEALVASPPERAKLF